MNKSVFLWVILVLSQLKVLSQIDCLAQLDSMMRFPTRGISETQVKADLMLSKLDSGICDKQIGYAEAYNNLGLVYWRIKDRQRAIELIEKGISLKLKQVDSFSTAMLPFYDNLYEVHRDFGSFSLAGSYLDLAQKAYGKKRSRNLPFLNHLIKSGIYYREIGRLEKSDISFKSALDLAEEKFNLNDSLKGDILIEYGTLHIQRGSYDQAEVTLNRAVSILRSKHPVLHMKAVDRLAKLHLESGNFSASESDLISNISQKKSLYPENRSLLIESINNLGILYFRINDLESARSEFDKLQETGQSEPLVKPFAENNLGIVELRNSNWEKAVIHFNKSKAILENNFGSHHPEYANVLNNLASAYVKLGRIEEAMDLYIRVLDLDKNTLGTDHPKYATTLGNLGQVYAQLGYFQQSRKLLTQGLAIKRRKFGSRHHEVANGLDNLGLINLVLGDTIRALHQFDSALSINIEHIQSIFPVLSDNQRSLLFDRIRFNQQRFSSIALSEKFIDTEWAYKALNYFINTKSILFYSSDKMRRLILQAGNQEMIDLYGWWRKRSVDLANAYLLSQEERSVQNIVLEDLINECHDLEKTLLKSINAESLDQEVEFIDWRSISEALDESTALLELIEYKEYQLRLDSAQFDQGFNDKSHYVAFVIKKDGVLEKVTWSQEIDFDKRFQYYSNALRYGLTDKMSYKELWAPIHSHLQGIERVLYAPDGDWFEINPAVFYDFDFDQFVGDNYDILNITSGKDLLNKSRKTITKTAQIMGNPIFTSFEDEELKPLIGAELEARQVEKAFAQYDWTTHVYFKEEATEERVKAFGNPGVLHLATHGYFKENSGDGNPLLSSGVFLTPGMGQDGRLTAFEVKNLPFDQTNLVVLSACETGLGKIHNGEGVFGLQRSFLVAGADYVIFSLTKVNDRATSNFMNLFYQFFTATNDIEESFFSAREQFRKVFPNPLLWGSFVLVAKH